MQHWHNTAENKLENQALDIYDLQLNDNSVHLQSIMESKEVEVFRSSANFVLTLVISHNSHAAAIWDRILVGTGSPHVAQWI